MLFVIDSNEFIFAIGNQELNSIKLFNALCTKPSLHSIRIPRTVFEEVKRNLSPEAFREFIELITNAGTVIDEDIIVSFELGLKYENLGFKPADRFIAAYAECIGADVLVSENRHFLSCHAHLTFKVLTAEACLKLIKSSFR